VIVGVIRRKPVLTHASIVCEGMLASVNSVNWLSGLVKQSSVTLNFPNEKSPCDAACRQNSLTACCYLFDCLFCWQYDGPVSVKNRKITSCRNVSVRHLRYACLPVSSA